VPLPRERLVSMGAGRSVSSQRGSVCWDDWRFGGRTRDHGVSCRALRATAACLLYAFWVPASLKADAAF